MRRDNHTRRRRVTVAATALLLIAGSIVIGTQLSSASASTTATAATAGCGSAAGLSSGTYSMQINGKSRSYILKVPDSYDSNHPYRLIFGLHWLGGNATDVANGGTVQPYYGLQALANNSAIFVAPQGLSESMGTGWANTGGQDMAFIDELVNTIESKLCVDTSQLFSLGFSFGGGMSYAIACARAKVFRAVAIYSGGVISGCSGGADPIAYLEAHGINDNVLPISGARDMRDRFVKNNGCTAASPPEPSSGSNTHTSFVYSGCSAGHPVEWYAFDGGHTPVPPDNGRTWLPQATWKFFTQFASTQPSGGPSSSPAKPSSPAASSPAASSPAASSPAASSPVASSPAASSPAASSPVASAGGCRIGYTVSAWNSGLTASIKITNTGSAAINGWSLAFALPAGQTITSAWNGSYSPASGQVTIRNANHNATIAPGATVDVGFQASHTGGTSAPTAFTLNGAPCATA